MPDDFAQSPSSAPIESTPDVQAPTPAAGVDWGDFQLRKAELDAREAEIAKREGRKPGKDAKAKKDPRFRPRDDLQGKSRNDLGQVISRARDEVERRNKEKEAAAPAKPKQKVSELYSRHIGEDMEIRRTLLERAAAEIGSRPGKPDEKEWASKEVRAARRELRSMFPNRKLSETWSTLQAWDEMLRERPREEATATVMRELYKYMPQDFPHAKDRPSDDKKDIRSSITRAAEDAEDLKELEEATKQFGKHLPGTLVRMSSILRTLVDDPANGLLRLGFNYEIQREETEQKAAKEAEKERQKFLNKPETKARTAEIHRGLDNVISRNMLPGLETEEMKNAVAEVMEDSNFPRSDDPWRDLGNAYVVVRARIDAKASADQALQTALQYQRENGYG